MLKRPLGGVNQERKIGNSIFLLQDIHIFNLSSIAKILPKNFLSLHKPTDYMLKIPENKRMALHTSNTVASDIRNSALA